MAEPEIRKASVMILVEYAADRTPQEVEQAIEELLSIGRMYVRQRLDYEMGLNGRIIADTQEIWNKAKLIESIRSTKLVAAVPIRVDSDISDRVPVAPIGGSEADDTTRDH